MALKVLIVDDSSFMRTIIKNIVLKKGCEIKEAENGQIAIERYKEFSPDVVFMDVIMPVMTGLEALKAIKQVNPAAKIVMCTSVGGQEKVVDEAVASGASDFVTKPFKPQDIETIIDQMLKPA